MNRDKWILHTVSGVLPLTLFAMLFLPYDVAKLAVAAWLAIAAAAVSFLIKKRSIPSMYARQVLGLMGVVALVCVMAYYLMGAFFGFYQSLTPLSFSSVWKNILPILVAVLATEQLRLVLLAQESRVASVLMYACGVLSEVALVAGFSTVYHFNSFMDAVGQVLLPALLAHGLYHYLAVRYGMWSVAVYRLVMLLYPYVIPYVPAVPDALTAFLKILMPIAIYAFIGILYEKKQKRALQRSGKWQYAVTAIALVLGLCLIMLVSGHFRYGVLVIATGSMQGELNKGDAAFYERYEDQTVQKGQIIVFEKNDVKVVHRVVDVQHINGVTQYITKGDNNNVEDDGYITNADIIGLVGAKLPYVGYPTIWLRNIVGKALRGE